MWAVYDRHGTMVHIESKEHRNGKLVVPHKVESRRPCITGHITEVGKMLNEVIEMAEPERADEFYVVRGTFIPEDKV